MKLTFNNIVFSALLIGASPQALAGDVVTHRCYKNPCNSPDNFIWGPSRDDCPSSYPHRCPVAKCCNNAGCNGGDLSDTTVTNITEHCTDDHYTAATCPNVCNYFYTWEGDTQTKRVMECDYYDKKYQGRNNPSSNFDQHNFFQHDENYYICSEEPTEAPTANPTSHPTTKPTNAPTDKPTAKPTSPPTTKPTIAPTAKPTAKLTSRPTAERTNSLTAKPTPTSKAANIVDDGAKYYCYEHPCDYPGYQSADPWTALTNDPNASCPDHHAFLCQAVKCCNNDRCDGGHPSLVEDLTEHCYPAVFTAATCENFCKYHYGKGLSKSCENYEMLLHSSPTWTKKNIKVTHHDEKYHVCSEVPYLEPPSSPTPKSRSKHIGKATGDPHFETFSGTKFDFHGACSLVMLQNPRFDNGLGMNIHIRTTIKTWWSYISAAVIEIGGDTLEVVGGPMSGDSPNFWINHVPGSGVPGNDGNLLDTLGGYAIHYHKISHKQSRFRIDLGNGEAANIETFNEIVNVIVGAKTAERFAGSSGLLGSYPNGSMLARDNSTDMGADPIAFAKAWQVLDTDPMLFHTVEGVQYPEECVMPSVTAKAGRNLRRRLGEAVVNREDAEKACSSVDKDNYEECISDVMVLNDVDVARAYGGW